MDVGKLIQQGRQAKGWVRQIQSYEKMIIVVINNHC